MGNLALQVGDIHRVVVHQRDAAHACGAQVQRHRRAQPPQPKDGDRGVDQTLLPGDIDFRQQNLPAVAQEAFFVH